MALLSTYTELFCRELWRSLPRQSQPTRRLGWGATPRMDDVISALGQRIKTKYETKFNSRRLRATSQGGERDRDPSKGIEISILICHVIVWDYRGVA